METETIDKLFLELSQVTNGITSREIKLKAAIETALQLLRQPYENSVHSSHAKALRLLEHALTA